MKISYIFMIFLVLSACTSPTSLDSKDLTTTAVNPGFPTETPIPDPTLTLTPTLTNSPRPSPTEIPTLTPTPTAAIPTCTNIAEFIRHLSVSDNTEIMAGTFFAKVWRIKNNGTCTWTTDYWFVFESGDEMSSQQESQLTKVVEPGDTIDVQVVLMAPLDPRKYQGDWLLRDPSGVEFGAGDAGNQPFSAIIVVEPNKSDFRKETLPCG